MPWTGTTLTQAVSDYCQNAESTFVSYIPTFILQTEDRIQKAAILPMNRATVTLTLVNGSNTVALPSNFLAPFELRMVSATNTNTPVEYVDVSYILELYPVPTVVSVPLYYSLYNNQALILGPTPDGNQTGLLHYFYKPASITTAGTSWLGTNAENCLLYGALAEAYTFMKGEPDMMKYYEDKFQAALADLKVLGEGMDMGDSRRMQERRTPNRTSRMQPAQTAP